MQLLTEITCSLETKSNIYDLVIYVIMEHAQSKNKMKANWNEYKAYLREFQFSCRVLV